MTNKIKYPSRDGINVILVVDPMTMHMKKAAITPV